MCLLVDIASLFSLDAICAQVRHSRSFALRFSFALLSSSMALSFSIAWKPVVLNVEGQALATLSQTRVVGDRHFFALTLQEPGVREFLNGRRGNVGRRDKGFTFIDSLKDSVVSASWVSLGDEEEANGLFADDEVRKPARRKRRVRISAPTVTIIGPSVGGVAQHQMVVLPLFAKTGRSGGSLWVEATAANVQYIVDAYDAYVDADENREANVVGPVVDGPAVANPVVAEPSVANPGVLAGSANVGDA